MESKIKKKGSKKKRRDPLTFIGDLKEELKKVSWTTKSELNSSTKIVLGSIFCFGIGIYIIDLLVKGVLGLVKSGVLFIFG